MKDNQEKVLASEIENDNQSFSSRLSDILLTQFSSESESNVESVLQVLRESKKVNRNSKRYQSFKRKTNRFNERLFSQHITSMTNFNCCAVEVFCDYRSLSDRKYEIEQKRLINNQDKERIERERQEKEKRYFKFSYISKRVKSILDYQSFNYLNQSHNYSDNDCENIYLNNANLIDTLYRTMQQFSISERMLITLHFERVTNKIISLNDNFNKLLNENYKESDKIELTHSLFD